MSEELIKEIESLPPLPEYFDLPEGWQQLMLTQYEEGWTNEEVIAWIAKIRNGKFSTNQFYSWYKRIPQFKEVVDIGTMYKKAWWLSQGRKNIGDSKFNTPLYIRMMSNLFAWRTDSSVIESVGEKMDLSKLTKEELDLYRKLRDRMKQTQSADSSGLDKKQENASTRAQPRNEFAGTGRD